MKTEGGILFGFHPGRLEGRQFRFKLRDLDSTLLTLRFARGDGGEPRAALTVPAGIARVGEYILHLAI